MANRKEWQSKISNSINKEGINFEDDFCDLLEKIVGEWHYETIKVASFEILRKLILFNGLSFEKYYRKIEDLVLKANSEKQIDKGVNKIVKEITEEIKSEK